MSEKPESTVSETVQGSESPANEGVRESRAKPEIPGKGDVRVEQAGAGRGSSLTAGATARVPQQALAPLQHGGRSTVALAPSVRGVKRELCKRLGVRYADLDAAGREAIDLYSRARAKLAAIDSWLERNPMVREDGTVAPVMATYTTLLNTSSRLLAQVLAVLKAMAREDDRYDAAVQALIAEGRKTRAGRECGGEEL